MATYANYNSSGEKSLYYILFEDATDTFARMLGQREKNIFPVSVHRTTHNKMFEGIRRGA